MVPFTARHRGRLLMLLQDADLISTQPAGVIWSLFNVGFAMVFSFGPTMLAERGWLITSAGSTISLVLWLSAVSVPFGGFLADRTKRPQVVLIMGCIVFAFMMIGVPRVTFVVPAVIALGIVCGVAAGPIMSLPARVLEPSTRAIGMGTFYTVFYIGMMLGPAIGGAYAKRAGTAGAAFDFGALMLLSCPILLWAFNLMVIRRARGVAEDCKGAVA